MALSNAQWRYYDHEVLRLPQDSREIYNGQVNRLVEKLTEKINADKKFKVNRARKAGSFAKHTILRRMGGVAPDVDVAIFLDDRAAAAEDYASLSDTIHEFLIASYPTKKVDDFTIGRRTATVQFIGSGLTVDVVPMITIPDKSGYGWQYFDDGTRVETYPAGQINFINTRKKTHPEYRALVRLAKQWRNHQDIKGLKSYAIELLMAHMFDQNPGTLGIEQRFREFLLFLAQSRLQEAVSFPENTTPPTFSDPVVVVDPVNSDNNVTSRISETERANIVQEAEDAYSLALEADAENDLSIYKEIFGPRFQVEAS